MTSEAEFEGRRAMRTTFDAVAEDYDRVRPRYPDEVFDDLVELAAVRPGARVVEVGCGTGQATIPLAQRGLNVVAVELGERLAALAAARASAVPSVEIVHAAFEDWEPERGGFDLVASFAAFHWVDPGVRYAKAARLLDPDGAIAIFDWQDTLRPGGDDFFVAVVEDYDAVVPEWEVTPPLPPERIGDREKTHLDASGWFARAEARHYVWSVTYTADDYVAMLGTQGSFGILDESRRAALFERIHRRITAAHGGCVRRDFFGTLSVARRAGSSPAR